MVPMSASPASSSSSGQQKVRELLAAARAQIQQNQLPAAAQSYLAVIRLQPDCFEAQAQLGAILNQAGQFAEAAECLTRALQLQPRFPNLNLLLGGVYKKLGRFAEAAQCCRREIEITPNNADGPYNLGLVLQNLAAPGEAAAAYRRALELRPDFVDALINLGTLERALVNLPAALSHLAAAVRLAPQNAEARWEWGTTLLAAGDFERGWPEYEWRWRQPDFQTPIPGLAAPRWEGAELHGRRILLYAEQGYGDSLQFVRYVSLVAARGGRVVLVCAAPLRSLFETVPGVELVATNPAQIPPCEVQASLMSLPFIFKTTLATIPAGIPYLTIPSQGFTLGPAAGNRRRIGLVWAGRPTHRNDRRRSLPFAALSGLIETVEVDWFSLQVGAPAAELAALVERNTITNLEGQLNDFGDTARAIIQMDLVIAVDTAVAHLAGALGKPVWLLLPYEAEWRWLVGRSDSPWYPTMRLFRQSQPGDWAEVIERVRRELAALPTSVRA